MWWWSPDGYDKADEVRGLVDFLSLVSCLGLIGYSAWASGTMCLVHGERLEMIRLACSSFLDSWLERLGSKLI